MTPGGAVSGLELAAPIGLTTQHVPVELVGDPPVQPVQPAAEAVAGHREQRLEDDDGDDRHPAIGRIPDASEQDDPRREERRTERLGEARPDLGLGRRGRTEPEQAPDGRPRPAEDE